MAKNKVSKAEQQSPVKYLKIESRNFGRSSEESGSGPYRGWSEDNFIDIMACKLVDNKGYRDLVADFEVERGDKVFVVVATYGSGDSFGSSSGNVHYEAVFKDAKKAFKCLDAMKLARKIYDTREDKWDAKFSYESESGQIIEQAAISMPFCGYFESLEGVEVKELLVS